MTTVAYDTVWVNARLATMTPGGVPYGAIEDGALAARDGAIAFVGARADLPSGSTSRTIDAGGRWITPGLIDPHTHLIFGGERVADFERRVAGESYVAAAGSGSGIAHTVALTRAADEETLFAAAARRLRTMIANGTTTVEIKSGYGLDVETELRLLRVPAPQRPRNLGWCEQRPFAIELIGNVHDRPPCAIDGWSIVPTGLTRH